MATLSVTTREGGKFQGEHHEEVERAEDQPERPEVAVVDVSAAVVERRRAVAYGVMTPMSPSV
jgi:hypothetical protein